MKEYLAYLLNRTDANLTKATEEMLYIAKETADNEARTDKRFNASELLGAAVCGLIEAITRGSAVNIEAYSRKSCRTAINRWRRLHNDLTPQQILHLKSVQRHNSDPAEVAKDLSLSYEEACRTVSIMEPLSEGTAQFLDGMDPEDDSYAEGIRQFDFFEAVDSLLTPNETRVIRMTYIDSKTISDIVKETGWTRGKVYRQLRNATKKLKANPETLM